MHACLIPATWRSSGTADRPPAAGHRYRLSSCRVSALTQGGVKMRRNYKMTVRRICTAVALVMVTAWGIPALALAPAALASPAVASAGTHGTPPRVHPDGAGDCEAVVENSPNDYTVTAKVRSGCLLGATTVPGVAPHVSIGFQLSACGGVLTWAGIDPITMTFAC